MTAHGEDVTLRPPSLLASYVSEGVLPPEAMGMKPAEVAALAMDDPEVAARLEENVPVANAPGRPGEAMLAKALAEADPRSRRDRVRAAFEEMPPESAEWLPVLFPSAVGNLPGAPWRHRITANLIRITAELVRERAELTRLQREDMIKESNRRPWDDDDLDDDIAQSNARIAYYDLLLGQRQQVILFNPDGDGEIAVLSGELGPATRNCGVIVPGTGTDLGNFDRLNEWCADFVASIDDGGLAVVAWMGGDLPDELHTASLAHFAADMGPRLAEFSHELRQEIAHTVPDPDRVKITAVGHSYGGSVVGSAEKSGLDADRVLHVASAGMGNGIKTPGCYQNPNQHVQRFSMTAPGDPIRYIQGRAVLQIGHGPNPDCFPGVVRLETGCYPDDETLGEKAGQLLMGPPAHSAVFTHGCEAWRNILGVLVGGRVTLWRDSQDEELRTMDVESP